MAYQINTRGVSIYINANNIKSIRQFCLSGDIAKNRKNGSKD